jgi:MFS family permease
LTAAGRKVVGDGQLSGLYLLTIVLMVAYSAVFTLLAEIRDAFGFSESAIGLIAGSTFAAGFIAQLGLSRLADMGHGTALLRLGLGFSIVGALWMVVAVELWEWVTSRTLLGFGAGCIRPGVRRHVIVVIRSVPGSALARWRRGSWSDL